MIIIGEKLLNLIRYQKEKPEKIKQKRDLGFFGLFFNSFSKLVLFLLKNNRY